MNSCPFRKNLKLQIVVCAVGVYLMRILWKVVGYFLAGAMSGAAFQAVNIAALFSLAAVPLLIAVLCRDSWEDLGFSKEKIGRQLLVGLMIGLAMAAVLTLVPLWLGLGHLVYGGAYYSGIGQALFGLLYFLVPIGLVEEFIFRGFFLSKLEQVCLSDSMPVVLSSLLFGIAHFNVMQIVTTGLIGAFFCLCRRKIPYCTVLSLAIAHGIHDWMIRLLPAVLQ